MAMKKLLLLFPFILMVSCNPDEETLPKEVTVSFSFDQFILTQDVEGFEQKESDWDHVFGGVGHVVFSEVNNAYAAGWQFDGSNLVNLNVAVPPGNYNIEMWFDASTIEDFFPFTASATNIEIMEHSTVELEVSTDYAIILVNNEAPVASSENPWFDLKKCYSDDPIEDYELTQIQGNYYVAYAYKDQNLQLIIKYDNNTSHITTDLTVEQAKVYKYKVVSGGTTNLQLDLNTLFEEYYFEIRG